jgi:hypothetical protein
MDEVLRTCLTEVSALDPPCCKTREDRSFPAFDFEAANEGADRAEHRGSIRNHRCGVATLDDNLAPAVLGGYFTTPVSGTSTFARAGGLLARADDRPGLRMAPFPPPRSRRSATCQW